MALLQTAVAIHQPQALHPSSQIFKDIIQQHSCLLRTIVHLATHCCNSGLALTHAAKNKTENLTI